MLQKALKIILPQLLSLPILVKPDSSAEPQPIWNIDINDTLKYNLSQFGLQNLQSATLDPPNSNIKITKIPIPATPTTPKTYPQVVTSFAKLKVPGIDPQNCLISDATLVRNETYQLAFICNATTDSLVVFSVNRKEMNQSKMVTYRSTFPLTPVPDSTRTGYSRYRFNCYSMYFSWQINSTILSCLDYYKDSKTASHYFKMGVVYILRWNSVKKDYDLKYFFLHGTQQLATAYGQFANGGLRWDLGLVNTQEGQKPRLLLFTPFHYADGGKFNYQTCYSEILTGDGNLITEEKRYLTMICRTPPTDFFKSSEELRSPKKENNVGKIRDQKNEEKVTKEGLEGLRSGLNDSQTSQQHRLEQNNPPNPVTCIIRMKYLKLNTTAGKPADYQLFAIAVQYVPDNTNYNKLIVCQVNTQAVSTASPLPTCLASALIPLSSKFPSYLDLIKAASTIYRAKNEALLATLATPKLAVVLNLHLTPTFKLTPNSSISLTGQAGNPITLFSSKKSLFVTLMAADTLLSTRMVKTCLVSKVSFSSNCRGIAPAYTKFFLGTTDDIGSLQNNLDIPALKGSSFPPPPADFYYYATITGNDLLFKSIPSGYDGNFTIKNKNSSKNIPLKIRHDRTVGFAKRQQNFTVYKGSGAQVNFPKGSVFGKFLRVSDPYKNIFDNRLFISSFVFNHSRKQLGGLPQAPQGMKLVKTFPLDGHGKFGFWFESQKTINAKTSFTTCLVFFRCHMVSPGPATCREISRNTFTTSKPVKINSMNYFGNGLVLINYAFMHNGAAAQSLPSTGVNSLRIVKISTGQSIAGPLFPDQTKFNLSSHYSYSSLIKVKSSATSFKFNISFVFNHFNNKAYTTTQAVCIRAKYDSVTNKLIPAGPTITKTFNTSTEIQNFDIERSRFGKMLKTIKFKYEDNGKYVYQLYSDLANGKSVLANSQNSDGSDSGLIAYKTVDYSLEYLPSKNTTQANLVYFSHLNLWTKYQFSYQLKYNSSTMEVMKILVFPNANFVQVLFSDKEAGGSGATKKYLMNYHLIRSDFRVRYHSKIELDGRVVDIEGKINSIEDAQYIQTVLTLAGDTEPSDVRVVVTKISQFSIKFPPSSLTQPNNFFKIQIEDSYGQKNFSSVQIQVFEPPKPDAKFKQNATKTTQEVNYDDLIRVNETIDLDKYLDITGSVANIEIDFEKGYQKGVDFVFKSRKYQTGQSSIDDVLYEGYMNGGAKQGLREAQEVDSGVEDQRTSGLVEDPSRLAGFGRRGLEISLEDEKVAKPTNLSIISSLKMERMRVIGNWIITQMSVGDDEGESYIKLKYKPQNFGKRDKYKDFAIRSKTVDTQTIKVVSFRASEDPFSSTETDTEIILAVKREVTDTKTQNTSYLIEIYKSNTSPQQGNKKADPFELKAQIQIPSFLGSISYRALALSQTNFCVVYGFKSLFSFILYTPKDSSTPSTTSTNIGLDLLNNYDIKVMYKKIITVPPDYWTARLERYTDSSKNTNYGVMMLAGYFSTSVMMECWWSADESNTFKSSAEFALFTEIVVNTHLIDCEPLRVYNASTSTTEDSLDPYLVKVQCMVAAEGAFNYLTEYTFDISKDDNMPLVLSKLVDKIATPDGFTTLQIESLPDIIVTRFANQNPDVVINVTDPSMCPYMIVVYRTNITMYPWAVYSCEDLNINSSSQLPHFSAYTYDDSFLWVDRQIDVPSRRDGKTSVVDLSNMTILTSHTIKNATIDFKKVLNFTEISATLKTLNGNKILKSLGLLTSSFMTPVKYDFSWNLWVWYSVMGVLMFIIIYCGIVIDLQNWKIFTFLFGFGGGSEDQRTALRRTYDALENSEDEEDDGERDEDPEERGKKEDRKITLDDKRPPQIILFSQRARLSPRKKNSRSSGSGNRFEQYSDDHDLNASMSGNVLNTPLTIATPLYMKSPYKDSLKTPNLSNKKSGFSSEKKDLIDVSEDSIESSEGTEERQEEFSPSNKGRHRKNSEGDVEGGRLGIRYKFDDDDFLLR